jgi:phosphoserine phosphatase RsbU/P
MGVLYLDTRWPGTAIRADDLPLIALLATTLALKISYCEFADELESAHCAQEMLLAHMPPAPPGYELHARLESCTAVAGDLYDVLTLPDGRCGLVLGDVVGKGLSAALQMAALLATLRATAATAASPLELVRGLHARACGCLGERGFVTLFVGYLDAARGQLDYVNAGQEGVGVLHADARWELLPTTGVPVGMQLGVDCEAASVALPPGALFAAWSDGFPEAHRAAGDDITWFETDRVLSTLRELRQAALPEAAAALFDRVRQFEGGAPAGDDRTLLLLRRAAA